jgi:hypothetical protein
MSNFNLNNLNDLINQANQIISCGPSCTQNQTTNQLKQNYLDAESNMVSAPQKFIAAQKEYITYTKGESGYNEFIDKELETKAEAIANTYQSKFDSEIENIEDKIKTYNGLLINHNNLVDLYKKYKKDNNKYEQMLKNKSSDILTNDRKTYYEDQGILTLKTYYFILISIYTLIVIVFLLSIFLVKSSVKLSIRFLILILLILYPFICYGFFHLLYKSYNNIKEYFPSNAYKNL